MVFVQVKLAVPASVLFNEHWNEIEKTKGYNDNIKFSKCVRKLTDSVDVANVGESLPL